MDFSNPLTVSILIATHDRCAILLRALDSLRAVRLPENLEVDLVVVANGCTDDTVRRLAEIAPAMPFPTRCVEEPALGLSHARNRAIAESSGEILAFLDDDVWVEKDWLAGLAEVFRQQPADIVVGPVALWWEAVAKPDWLGRPAERLLSCLDHGSEVIELHRPGQGIGANFALRRDVIRTVGLFNPALGRVGRRTFAGEETELLSRAFRVGMRMFYAPRAAVRHWVAPERITPGYLSNAAYGNGLARPFLLPELSPIGALGIMTKYGFRAAAYGLLESFAWIARSRKARINHHLRRKTSWGNVVSAWQRVHHAGPVPTVPTQPTAEPFRPVFVVGNERSGTTLLAVLLGRHSALAMMPETHFFRLVPRDESSPGMSHEELLRRFHANKTPVELHLDHGALAQRFERGPATHAALFRSVLEQFATGHGKPRAGEKTPLHLLNVPTVLTWFVDARIICIVRDGRDVVLSLMAMPWATERRLRQLCWRWMQLLRIAERWQSRYPGNFLMIRYEDLLRDPENILRKADAFAGLEFEVAQLNSRAVTDIVDPATEPWKANALAEIDPSRIAAWRQKATPQQIRMMNALMGPALQRCGYEDTRCRRTITDALAAAWFRSGLFYLWMRLVEKHLPGRRASRRAARLRDQGAA